MMYSRAIDGILSDREIEVYSRRWLESSIENKKRILWATLEAELIARKLIEGCCLYEAIISYLCLARGLLSVTYKNDDDFVLGVFVELKRDKLVPLCEQFFEQVRSPSSRGIRFLHVSWPNSMIFHPFLQTLDTDPRGSDSLTKP